MQSWKKTFIIIWTGQLFSTLTSSIVGFSIVFWLSFKTGSAEVLAYAMIAALAPQIILGLFTGVFVDRWNRKWTMICADSFIALSTGILCLLFYFNWVEIWHIYFLLALRSAGSAFHMPAMQASVPLLAPETELMRISGVNQIILSISNIGGPAIAAVLISNLTMPFILSLDIIGAFIACTCLLFVFIPNPSKKESENINILQEVKVGLKAIFHKKGLSWLFACDVISMFFIIPVVALFPLMTLTHFKGSAYEMSLVEIGWGAGMLIGGVIIGLKKVKAVNKIILIACMCINNGLLFFIIGLLPSSAFIIFISLTVLGGTAAAIWNGTFTVILQTNIQHDTLGRAFSTYDSLMLLPSIPGLLATGFIAEKIGISHSFVISGLAICIVGIILCSIPSLRELGKTKEENTNKG